MGRGWGEGGGGGGTHGWGGGVAYPRPAHLVWCSTSCNFSFCAYTFKLSHTPLNLFSIYEHYKLLIFLNFSPIFFAARSVSKI